MMAISRKSNVHCPIRHSKKLNTSFIPSLTGWKLLVKQWEIELSLRFQLPCTLHYFDPVGLLGAMLRDPDVMQHFVCYPQEKFTTCGKRIYDETTSAEWTEWFHSAFNESHASEDGKLKAGHLFVGIGLFSDGSAIDKMQKHSEHPLLKTMLNLSICDETTGLSVVEHNNILSTALVVPALAPASISICMST